MKQSVLLLLVFALGTLTFFSCSRFDEFTTSSSVDLSFSLDTLRFDTVFTELGSATRFLKVYNSDDKAIKISKVSLERGSDSPFRLNVNGFPVDGEATDIDVWGNDSIYIFAEVTIDPNQPLSESPFVIEDKILFETNGNMQEVHVEAWGQNANYFPSRFNAGVQVLLSCQDGTIQWNDPKPYVIYGEVLIDDCLLEISAGTQIYVHGGVFQDTVRGIFNDGSLITLQNGSIHAKGTAENPIVIQGDRLEEPFQEVSGQWNGVVVGRGSRNNIFEYTTIKNARFGMIVDSLGQVDLINTQIFNTVSSGIIGFAGNINAENCLVYNNGSTSIRLTLGGNYDFNYCTVASYGVDAGALSLENFFCYDDPFECNVLEAFPLRATFRNSILFGSRRDEISLLDITQGDTPAFFEVSFQSCIVKVDELPSNFDGLYADFFENECMNCINGTRDDALFVSVSEDDYHLDTLSIAEGMALPNAVFIDLEANLRDMGTPDIGCYEYQN